MRNSIAFTILILSSVGLIEAQTEKGGRGGTGGGGVLQYIKARQRNDGLEREAAVWCAEFQQAALEGLRITELLRDAHFSFYSENRKIQSLGIVITDNKIEDTRTMLTNLCETGHFKIDRTIKDDEGDALTARNFANGELRFNPNEWAREQILAHFNYLSPDGSPLNDEDQDVLVNNMRRMVAIHEGWSMGKTPIECDGHYAVSSLIIDLHLGSNRCAAVKTRIWLALSQRFAEVKIAAAAVPAGEIAGPTRAKIEALISDAHLVADVYGSFIVEAEPKPFESKAAVRELDEYLAVIKQRDNLPDTNVPPTGLPPTNRIVVNP